MSPTTLDLLLGCVSRSPTPPVAPEPPLLFDQVAELGAIAAPYSIGFGVLSMLAFAIVSVSGVPSRSERQLCGGIALAFGGAALAAPHGYARVIGLVLVGLGSLGLLRGQFIPDEA